MRNVHSFQNTKLVYVRILTAHLTNTSAETHRALFCVYISVFLCEIEKKAIIILVHNHIIADAYH